MANSFSLRKVDRFDLSDYPAFISKALHWASTHSHCAYFTSNHLPYLYQGFPHFLAVGGRSILSHEISGAFKALKDFHQKKEDWLIGYMTYDLKNEIENLTSTHPATIDFEPLYFFQPETLIFFDKNTVQIESFTSPREVYQDILNYYPQTGLDGAVQSSVAVEPKISKEQYIRTLQKIKAHIIEGDVYEMNYCMEFFGSCNFFDPVTTFEKLNRLSPMPFATFQRFDNKYLLCASPERFLKKENQKIISQPIKGTIARGTSALEDEQLKTQLYQSEKERAENMMIVDLVRNDLAKSALPGTVNVDELFGIYSYEKVHQMVSTVSAESLPSLDFIKIIKNAFPMGSMTGAPKFTAMQLIEQYEKSKRGLFSGAAGFIKPTGDFDFNVVIRSLMYDHTTRKLSFQVGSAITYDSIPAREYEECLLKAKSIFQVLDNNA